MKNSEMIFIFLKKIVMNVLWGCTKAKNTIFILFLRVRYPWIIIGEKLYHMENCR